MLMSVCQMIEGVERAHFPSRQLNLLDRFPLHKKISSAILSGDIDRAAELVVKAVREGDGSSIVRGFSEAQSIPGKNFSVIQVFVNTYAAKL